MFLQESEEFIASKVGSNQVVTIYPELTYQTIRGFGGAFTEASGYNFSKLSKEKKEIVLNAYFGKNGIHYTLGRTHINSCDFSLFNYAYLEKDEDINQKFNRDRDREYIVPMIKAAIELSKDTITFLASPWSPPAFMKTNHDMNHGGELKEEYKKDWAKYIATYVKDCKKDGITISMLTVQNEPEATQVWDSCRYSSAQEMEFVRDYLGPVLEEEGLSNVKIYVWDHNKELLYERAKEILSDSRARECISGMAFHWYTGDHFEALDLVREQFPEQELLFTEGCVEYGRFFDSSEIWKAEMYA
ncbi:glycoside hydrolase family 30 protein, partial [Lachnoclostridium sp.]|uniref:glycoside hydrolase family 30 protein n=1 Tax=Lachnoclostridium sp. TaxID=2028282 RepID=UPI00289BC33E